VARHRPDSAGNLLEIVVLIASTAVEIVIHAMPMRPKYRKLLEPVPHDEPQPDNVITDADIEALADEAERGYDPAELIARCGKRGRPTLGGARPSTVESVRLDPQLNEEVAERAKRDGVSTSDVIREALRRYLHAS
jgi:predicted HicB family RNase H-like nuclease